VTIEATTSKGKTYVAQICYRLLKADRCRGTRICIVAKRIFFGSVFHRMITAAEAPLECAPLPRERDRLAETPARFDRYCLPAHSSFAAREAKFRSRMRNSLLSLAERAVSLGETRIFGCLHAVLLRREHRMRVSIGGSARASTLRSLRDEYPPTKASKRTPMPQPPRKNTLL
jgi:hypothetical protein